MQNQTTAPTRRTVRAGADGAPGEQGACGLS